MLSASMISPISTMLWRVPLLVAVCVTGILGASMILGLEKFALFFPERSLAATPRAEGLAYEDAWFPASDGVKLHGWLVPAPGARVTLIWFHGNAGNISDRVPNLGYLHRLLRINVFIFDYRGYGQSEGRHFDLSEEATYRDGEGALAYLRARPDVPRTSLVYFGRSLGAAIAVEMAHRRPAAGLILETPFTTLKDVARVHYPFVPLWFLRTKYESLRKIPEIRVPLLILHGDRDEVIPLEHAQRLYAAANAPKQLYVIHGAHHNDTYVVGGVTYFDMWRRFLLPLNGQPSGVITR
jgi:fermentation-respiration switch protein FrsA (DUF1100 family)